MSDDRPRRTLLYMPASNARALEKARDLAADVIILDLEDAVAPEAKPAARAAAVAALAAGFGRREAGIRVNGFGTAWSDDDFAAAAQSAAAFVLVPKIDSPAQAADAVARARGKPLWAMIETPRAVLEADAIAAVPGVAALVAGFADLAKDLRARPGPGRLPLLYSASRILLSARAAGIPAFDGVFTDIADADGLAAEAAQALALGFDGKTCIHPSQLDCVNRTFSPSEADIAHAHGLIAAHTEAMASGKAVATFKGKMVELLHVLEARRTLKIAEVITEMGGVAERVVEAATD
jgi:citrate lyase beta subunit